MKSSLPIAFKIKAHTRRILEIKVHYHLNPKNRHEAFSVENYFFIPPSLEINSGRFSSDLILHWMKNHLRFSTPLMPLAQIVSRDNPDSPLVRIRRILEGAVKARDVSERRLFYEMRMLSNMVRARLREHIIRWRREKMPLDREQIQPLLNCTDALMEESAALKVVLESSPASPWVYQNYAWMDESLSLLVEDWESRLFEMAQTRVPPDLKEEIRGRLGRQQEYRKIRGYHTVPSSEEDARANESYVYHSSMLKKWAQSALFVHRRRTKRPKRWGEIVAASAAGAAMAFTLAATFLTGNLVPAGGVAWSLVLVLVYIFKDRIKDGIKNRLRRLFPKLIPDDELSLVDPSAQKVMGRSTTHISFKSRGDLSDEVLGLRQDRTNPFRDILPPENVLLVEKVLQTKSRRTMKNHNRLETVTEILRFNLDDWMREMDETRSPIRDFRRGEVETLRAPRVYHVNLLIRLRINKPSSHSEILRYRLVLNRKRILRIEPVNTTDRVKPIL